MTESLHQHMRRKPLGLFLGATFGVLALAAWAEAIPALLGRSEKPPTLIALQLGLGAAATATSWGSWRRARWAPIAAVAYGALAAGLLLALPSILDLPVEARAGLRTGAAAVLVFALLSGAYFRSDVRRSTSQISAEQANERWAASTRHVTCCIVAWLGLARMRDALLLEFRRRRHHETDPVRSGRG